MNNIYDQELYIPDCNSNDECGHCQLYFEGICRPANA
jgi:hypothetical protein